MYNFLNLIFGVMVTLSAIALMSSACLIGIAGYKSSRAIKCVHLYSKKVFFYCIFVGGCIHLIF